MQKIIRTIFYGNIFYGVCTVALCIESNLAHNLTLNSIRFYLLVFLATVVFYGRIYYRSSSLINVDERTQWYRDYRPTVRVFLLLSSAIIVADIVLMIVLNLHVLKFLPTYYLSLLAVVPVVGAMYSFKILSFKKLRHVGWLKPFVIGFVWAGVVTIFPVLFWEVRNLHLPAPSLEVKTLLWLQNFLFISTLAVVFDIKDYSSDKRQNLNTYPAALGIRKTIFFVIIPLNILSFAVICYYNYKYQIPATHTLLQVIPNLILLVMTQSLQRERKLIFYLAAIDGLMFLKAIVGISSILFL